jgi:hypothetical protein
MSVVEDVRKVVQDLVAPELKSLAVKLEGIELEVKLRGENVATKIETVQTRIENAEKILTSKIESSDREAKVRDDLTHVKLEALTAKMEAQYQSILYSLNLDKRVETLERDKQQSASA